MRNKILFYLNGRRHELNADKASMMLAEYLRYDQSLTGTKIVCAEGDCGACTVLKYFPHINHGADVENFIPINSCITTVAQLDGSSIVTVDALNKNNHELHEVQKAMIKCHGTQCGFCTPGFVMAITGLVEEKISNKEVSISQQEAKNCITGNLCRCTGYQPIINAVTEINLHNCEGLKERFVTKDQIADLKSHFKESVILESEDFNFFAPKKIKEALSYLKDYPDTRIIGSATDLGVIHNKKKIQLKRILSLHLIEELYETSETGNEIKIGARVTLSEFRHFIKSSVPELANYLDIFASPQIKNVATVVGNIANASPIGDTPPALLALDAKVEVMGLNGQKEINLSDFFIGYRKINISQGEIITAIKFKIPSKNSTIRLFKNSNRKDLDISAVNFAIRVDWKDSSHKEIGDIIIAAGGVAATPVRLKRTEAFLKSKIINNTNLEEAVKELHSEFTPLSDLRASAAYRHVLIEKFFRRFFNEGGHL